MIAPWLSASYVGFKGKTIEPLRPAKLAWMCAPFAKSCLISLDKSSKEPDTVNCVPFNSNKKLPPAVVLIDGTSLLPKRFAWKYWSESGNNCPLSSPPVNTLECMLIYNSLAFSAVICISVNVNVLSIALYVPAVSPLLNVAASCSSTPPFRPEIALCIWSPPAAGRCNAPLSPSK